LDISGDAAADLEVSGNLILPFATEGVFMKWLNEIKTRFIYIGRMFRLLWEIDKAFLPLILAETVITVIQPFITMYLIKYSIDMLTNASDFRSYLPTVLVLLGSQLAANVMGNWLLMCINIHNNTTGYKFFAALLKKSTDLNYEMLLDKELMEKRQMAFRVIEEGRFFTLISDFRSFVRNFIIICGIVYVVAQIDPWILLIVFALVIVNGAVTVKRMKVRRKVFEGWAAENRKIGYFISLETDAAIGKEIRLFNMQDVLFRVYKKLQSQTQSLAEKNSRVQGAGWQMASVTNFCLNALVYGFLGFKVLVQRLVTVGDFSLYLNAIMTFNTSMREMIDSFIAIADHGRYLKDHFDYMDITTRYDAPGAEPPAVPDMVFTFENVSFCYPHQTEPALKNVNLTIGNRERLSIVGENGAGKTTLIKLLMRLFEPTEGHILLNGVDIRNIDYRKYLGFFSSVFQDFRFFAFRIADNISSMQDGEELDREKLRDCLDKAGLLEKIESLDKGLDTYLYKLYEEDGVELSGGESQKLAIARALYKDAPVVILDEPTAALDPRAEYEIYTRFFEMVKNKTSVFITHRLSSTRFCDRIVVLKNGEIVETGSHDELLARKGYYAELFNMQAQFYTDTENSGEPAMPPLI
jgi:ABC-type multidrug transport system fused ATPase/permease subunit